MLNYTANQIQEQGRLTDVEIVVTDWGSKEPLKEALHLTSAATQITRFIEAPISITDSLEKDAPFAEVYANNVAIRRAKGVFIGRIDQDTLVGAGFLSGFFRLIENNQTYNKLSSAFLFSRRRSVPLPITRAKPNFKYLIKFLKNYHYWLPIEGWQQQPWFDAPVGILLMHRKLWETCQGYDERLLYWGYMDAEVGFRIKMKYPLLNLEKYIGCYFYHLRHKQFSLKKTRRRKNKRLIPTSINTNNDNWGLKNVKELIPIGKETLPRTEDHSLVKEEKLIKDSIYFMLLKENVWELLLALLRIVAYLFKSNPFTWDQRYQKIIRTADKRDKAHLK